LHTWTLEGRLSEITIPTKKSTIYELVLTNLEQKTRAEVVAEASNKIESILPVTDPRKAIGNDFRRPDIRQSWKDFSKNGSENDLFSIATFTCTASSGTYMRSLAEELAKRLDSTGLAFYIHRTEIGQYDAVNKIWSKRF
jgi:tRNA U55 pseudouridine synthase TruB